MIKQRLYIFPGWGEKISDKNYRILISAVKNNFDLIPIKIRTRNPRYSLGSKDSLDKITTKLSEQILLPCNSDTLLGFSIGALLAYQVALKHNFNHLVLCSLSPFLGNDIKKFNRKELSDLTVIQYNELLKASYANIKSNKTTIIYGENEIDEIKKRSKILGKRKNWKHIEIPDAKHELSGDYLIEVIRILISKK